MNRIGGFEGQAAGRSSGAPVTLSDTIIAGMDEVAVLTLAPHGRIRTWNRGATRLTGYEASDAIGRRFPAFLADHARTKRRLRLPAAESVSQVWWRTRGGHLRRVEERITPYPGPAGRVAGWSVIAREVDARAGETGETPSLERERTLRADLEAAERRASFLAEASSTLVASSLSFDSTVRGLARLAVSRIADWCVVYARDEGGTLRCREVAHRDPAREERVRRITGSAVPADSPVTEVVAHGRATVFATVDDGFLRALFGIRGLDGALAFASSTAILTPLFGRGESIGAVLFLSATPQRPYDQDDLDLAEELGRRTAIAIENARL
jgi:PAS domain S-box-containing protein